MDAGRLPAVLAADAERLDASAREVVGEVIGAHGPSLGIVAIRTCHRVEAVGSAGAVERLEEALIAADEAREALQARDGREAREAREARQKGGRPGDLPPLRRLEGEAAIRHVLRLAAGLESAVLGEDQILAQVRDAAATDGRRAPVEVRRLLDVALAVGRAARAGRGPRERDLGARAVAWLAARTGGFAGERLLVVGAGEMGERVAVAGARAGARVTVANRSIEHATALATRVGGEAVDLETAASLAPVVRGIAIALSGPWSELRADGRSLPPTVDLSAPPALSAPVRAAAGDRLVDIDSLFAARSSARIAEGTEEDRSFVERAERLVEEGVERYRRWLAGREAVPTLRSLRDRAEERRRDELERLLRRLPSLDDRERSLVTAFSVQLTAALLHEPSTRLREDEDGTLAGAARRLFDLPA